MDVIDQQFSVTFRYPVHFTHGVFDARNRLLQQVLEGHSDQRPADVVVVVDAGARDAHPGLLERIEAYLGSPGRDLRLTAPVLVVPGGETVKNDPRHLDAIYRRLHQGGLCRQSYVVAVGGGAVLDAVGYAAATAHRGVRLVRVPTTVLSQDDSAMGVKCGVNAFGKKNYLGAFAPPFAVVNDFDFLPTLADRDWLGGVSEAIKAALIKDPDLFDFIEGVAPKLVARDRSAMEALVRRSAALHLSHIATAGDPFEQSSSRPLDFGHWAAHRLEQLTGHRLRHGEAVAIGIAIDTTYSHVSGLLGRADWRRVIDLLTALKLSLTVPELFEHLADPYHERSVLGGLPEFREHLGGRLTIMLLRGIGQPVDVHEIDTGVMIRSIRALAGSEAPDPASAPHVPFAGAAFGGSA
jgi:3-dehydroquinate synthase